MSLNPKDEAAKAESRTPLDLLESVADAQISRVLEFGAVTKGYGVRNYVQSPIEARTYIAAIRRHLDAWKDGEDDAADSGLSHLAHIGANVHILLAAMSEGTFVDNRGPFREQERIEDLECERVRKDFVTTVYVNGQPLGSWTDAERREADEDPVVAAERDHSLHRRTSITRREVIQQIQRGEKGVPVECVGPRCDLWQPGVTCCQDDDR